MAKKDEQALRILYANLMDEVKVRISCIDLAVRGQTRFPGPVVREFCWLQLRLLCELISLGCMVAHGDIPAAYSKRLGKEYSADAIMKALEALRPHFYPLAMRETAVTPTGPMGNTKHHTIAELEPQPFPKASLLDLYGQSHKHLHRGNFRKLLNSETPIETKTDFPEIISWAQKMNDQLAHHFIAISKDKFIFCLLRNPQDNFKVQVGTAEKREKPL